MLSALESIGPIPGSAMLGFGVPGSAGLGSAISIRPTLRGSTKLRDEISTGISTIGTALRSGA